MRVHFTEREPGPERLVCEAEIHFEEGPIDGTRLVGFSLWRSPEGEVYVTFSSRAFGAGAERLSSTTCGRSTAQPSRSSA